MTDEQMPKDPELSLLHVTGRLAPTPRVHYVNHPFTVPAGASKLWARFVFRRDTLAQLGFSLHDPAGFRGQRTRHYVKGSVEVLLWLAPDDASEGALPGPLRPGEWRAQVDVERLGQETDYELSVWAEFGAVPEPLELAPPFSRVIVPRAGWYRGELHAHSTESDGKYPVADVVAEARRLGLDYLALTEHYTVSHWRKLAGLDDRIALLHSCEITSHQGHANLHGLRSWVDVYVDRPDWSMNQAADATHAQGGLFCVNHPMAGDYGWRSYDFDWSKADLFEIFHNLEGPNNNLQPALWDHHLRRGRRLVGVAGADSHDPFAGAGRLGAWITWVYAPELSERGILDGLAAGRVYASCGPELRFTARDAARGRAEMWGSLPLGPVTLDISVKTAEALRLFVLKNGYPFATLAIPALPGAWQTMALADTPSGAAYYRVELHAVYENAAYPGLEWRDFTTVRALSNPIWAGGPACIA